MSIEDVIGEYLPLKRAGRNFRGLSPFTSEKTPSFMVSPEKQIWHDFSSNKGGNMFSFVMEMEGVDFKEALELLARKAGVDLDQYRKGTGSRGGPSKERLLEALDAAAKFYQVQLSANEIALKYVLNDRKLTKETIVKWRMGYSPNTGKALWAYLNKLGFSNIEMQRAGLTTKRGSVFNDMFRGRLMIPLQDTQGKVIGFTARQLPKDDYGPKYINTPQTILYDKSRHIFGLHLAKQAIRENQFAVVTEGNLDVISSHQSGVRQVVATAGTAMTEAHLRGLTRFAGDIRICFDSDKAGVAATERAITIASRLHVALSVIDIVGGKDPDELINKDPRLWQEAVEHKAYAVDWLIDFHKKHYDLESASGKREFSDAVLPIVTNLDDPVEQDHYINVVSKELAVSRESLEAKINKNSKKEVVRKKPIKSDFASLSKDQLEISKTEDHLLCLLLKQVNLRNKLSTLTTDMLGRDVSRKLLQILHKQPDRSEKELNALKEIGEYVKILGLQYEELYQGLEFNELVYEANRLQIRLIERYVKRQKQEIALKLATANEKQTNELLNEARRLDNLLRINLGDNIHA